jgi:type I restriction enzyme M protein
MATSQASSLVDRVWNYCTVLRDDGVSYSDYLEQLTTLLFLKMEAESAEEAAWLGTTPAMRIPPELTWDTLRQRDGAELENHFRTILERLGQASGMLGTIFRKAINRIQDPAKLKRLIDLIDGQAWLGLDLDVKGEIYEGLLEKNAGDVRSGAGQYFTPRALIRAIVDVMRPAPGQRLCDPACGIGGFLLAAYDYLQSHYDLTPETVDFLQHHFLRGVDIVDAVARLCAMNLYLHGIGGEESPVAVNDSLRNEPSDHFELVLTNPPFGRKSSITVYNGAGEGKREAISYERQDFWATTSNKQLNFVQHVRALLATGGRAAMVVPDNVLFEGGAGETIRRQLLRTCEVHTLLRLPTGIWYSPGVKANVLFFDRRPGRPEPWTDTLWIYDLRTNQNFTLKQRPLTRADLDDFVACYHPENRHTRQESERFRAYSYETLLQRDQVSLDILWLKDDSLEDLEHLPDPAILAAEIVEHLRAALDEFEGVAEELGE